MNNQTMKMLKDYLLVIIALIIVGGSIAIIIPGYQEITTKRAEIKTLESMRDAYDEKIRILDTQNVPQLEGYLKNASLALLTVYDAPSILNSLEKIADASDVSLSGLQFSDPTTGKKNVVTTSNGASEYNFSLSTTADYAHVIAMLRNFERTLPVFTLDNVTVRRGEGSDLSFSFGVTSYYKSLPENLGDKSNPVAELTETEIAILEELEGYRNYQLIPDTSGTGTSNPFR